MSAIEPVLKLDDFPYLQGNYAPVRLESTFDATQLRVSGRVPTELRGAFMRNGPNVAFQPNHYVYPLDGDGMIHAVYFEDGAVSYRNRWVETAALKVERLFGRAIYGSIGRLLPVPKDVVDAGGDPSPYKNTANTNVILHGGRLLALWEVGPPHAMTAGLDTIGIHDFDGTLHPGQNLSAHPKICPLSGEMITCSQPADRLEWTAMIFDRSGKFSRKIAVPLPYKSVIHDLAITAHYILIYLSAAVVNPVLLQQGKFPVEWHDELPMRIGVIPRDGVSAVRWFEAPSFFSWHFCNAFESGHSIHIDYIWIAKIPISQQLKSGIESQPRKMHRLRLDLNSAVVLDEEVSDTYCEFARVDDRRCGARYRFGYAAANTMKIRSEHHGYNCTAQFDFDRGVTQTFEYGAAANAGEPVVVPKTNGDAELDAYVMSFVNDPTAGAYLAIFDAATFSAGPIAKVHIPTRVPNGFHANWMPDLSLPT